MMHDDLGTTSPPPADDRDQLVSALRDNLGHATLALSAEQSRLWFLQQLFPTAPFHHCRAVDVGAPCDAERLERAFADLARTHEILRSAFVQLGPKPIRLLKDDAALRVRVVRLDDTSDDALRGAIDTALAEDTRPFDFRSPPLVRLTAIEHGGRCALLLTAHQLVSDRYSLHRLLDGLVDRCYGRGTAPPTADDMEAELSFRAFVRDEIAWLANDRSAADLKRMRDALDGAQALNFPTDLPTPELRSSRGSRLVHDLSADTAAGLLALADAEATTIDAIVLAAYQLFLAWHCNQDDVAVGVSADEDDGSGRIGPFFDPAIVRTRVSRHGDFATLVRATAAAHRSAFVRPRTPYAEVVNRLQPSRDLNRTPLFQAEFWSDDETSFAGRWNVPVAPLAIDPGAAPFDLSLGVVINGDAVRLVLEHSVDILLSTSVGAWLQRLVRILDAAARRPDTPLPELVVLSSDEWQATVAQWKSREHDFPESLGAHDLFARQAAQTPDRIGAVAAGGRHVTYAEIDRRASQIAALLKMHGIQREDVVALGLDHSPEALMGVLGIWKAGAAYVPFDAQWPAARTAYVINDSRAKLLLVNQRVSAAWSAANIERVFIEDANEPLAEPTPTGPRQLAYVIYTSGSTGMPKGVAVEHRSLVNNLTWRQRTWPLTDADRILQSLAPTFDPSLWTMFWPLTAGAAVVYPTANAVVDLAAQAAVMTTERISIFGGAPSLHSVLAEEERFDTCRSVRYVFSGGETLSPVLNRALRQRFHAEVINVYGPTEATMDCAAWTCSANEDDVIPIGTPIANTPIHIVNRYGQLNPPHVQGEIWIGGATLARGYVGNPALTAERFVPDPFSGVPGSRVYRTGDIGEMRDDRLYFVGRVDDQVKVRGFRIELAEIERTLAGHPRVRQAAAVVDRSAPTSARLVAFILVTPGEPVSQDELTEFLATRLPKYMVPEAIATVATFPLTSSGKVDKPVLLANAASAAETQPFRPPRDTLETEIANVVAAVLNREAVGIDQDIFDLGCNSLLVARIASRLSSIYKIELPVRQMFQDPTVAGIAELVALNNRGQTVTPSSWTVDQMIADSALDPQITGEGLPLSNHLDPKLVFITGATGYIGCFLIERLLRTTSVECACLVRATGPEEGMARIRDTMRGYDAWDDAFASRIHPVVGDLGKERLGIDPAVFMKLAADVDVIYHCGALVNFVYPYAALRGPNVFGTHEILRLACTTRLKPVHYTSTVDLLLMTHTKRPFTEDDMSPLDTPNEVPDGYGRSKWVAEKMLVTARSRGIPVTVYRLGLTIGHTGTGATQTNDYLLVGLKGCLDLGISYMPDMLMDFVTVDFVAAALAHISRQPQSAGKVFHIWNPRPAHIEQIMEWVRSFGYGVERVPLAVFREAVLKHVDASNALYPFIPGLRVMVEEPMTAHHPSVMAGISGWDECRNTYAALEGSGIECPPLTPQIAQGVLSYLVKIGFLPAPVSPLVLSA